MSAAKHASPVCVWILLYTTLLVFRVAMIALQSCSEDFGSQSSAIEMNTFPITMSHVAGLEVSALVAVVGHMHIILRRCSR